MTKDEYAQYLKSDHWLKISQERKDMDDHHCQLCGSTDNLQVHHISYKRLWCEIVDLDLVTLCKTCHFMLHDALSKREEDVKTVEDLFVHRFEQMLSESEEARKIYEQYAEQKGMIMAYCAAELAERVPPSKSNRAMSIINRHFNDAYTVTKRIGINRCLRQQPPPYSVALKELASIRRNGAQHGRNNDVDQD